jgi:hypothetical protein
LRFLVAHAHAKRAPGRAYGEVAVAETTDQVERLARWLLHRCPRRVVLHVELDRSAYVRRCAEVAVRRNEPVEGLMRPLKVVPVDEETETPRAVREVREHRLRQHLVPQRLPETLDLPERLRMLRAALHVTDPVAPELPLELRLTAPRRVLPTLVRQDLRRRSERRDAAFERLHHELRFLMMRERVRDDEPRVIVHERHEVEPLVTTQQEREQVRLPQLVRRRALEAARWTFASNTLGTTLDET